MLHYKTFNKKNNNLNNYFSKLKAKLVTWTAPLDTGLIGGTFRLIGPLNSPTLPVSPNLTI